MPLPQQIVRAADVKGVIPPWLIALYGRGGLGKTTTVASLARHSHTVLAADFAGGLKVVQPLYGIDVWPITKPFKGEAPAEDATPKDRRDMLREYAAQFAAFLRYARGRDCEHDVLSLDGFDQFIRVCENLVAAKTKGGLMVRANVAMQVYNDLLTEFIAVPRIRFIVMNEYYREEVRDLDVEGEDGKRYSRQFTHRSWRMPVFPATAELIHSWADAVLWVYRDGSAGETPGVDPDTGQVAPPPRSRFRSLEVTTRTTYIEAKRRNAGLWPDGAWLSDLPSLLRLTAPTVPPPPPAAPAEPPPPDAAPPAMSEPDAPAEDAGREAWVDLPGEEGDDASQPG